MVNKYEQSLEKVGRGDATCQQDCFIFFAFKGKGLLNILTALTKSTTMCF